MNPETMRLLYSNFYMHGSPRFAYDTRRRAYAIQTCPPGTGTIAPDGRFRCCISDAGGNKFIVLTSSRNDCGKQKRVNPYERRGPQSYLPESLTSGSRFDPNRPAGAMPTGLKPLDSGSSGGMGGGAGGSGSGSADISIIDRIKNAFGGGSGTNNNNILLIGGGLAAALVLIVVVSKV